MRNINQLAQAARSIRTVLGKITPADHAMVLELALGFRPPEGFALGEMPDDDSMPQLPFSEPVFSEPVQMRPAPQPILPPAPEAAP